MNLHGFQLVKETELPDTHGVLYQYVHEKTKAGLIWLKRADENKTFSITFKTTPENDTGVFHILEHSVLNGSEKYPVKEPFVDLLKGSMQTFLNAFTAPDKTMYPVSSRNDKDFMNLMSVYMDAVFHPAIYTNPNIFYQEGWHYEIREKDALPVYKGVVLNEMKGAFSSVDESIINELNRMLFPDNCYKYVSGGDPAYITDLSYEQFIATHQKYYHPSNARIFLDGDLKIEEVLAFINDEYLSHYDAEDIDFTIPMQKVLPAQSRTIQYEMNPGEETEHRTQYALAKIVSSYTDAKKNLAWSVLSNVLVSSNESLLKKNILEAGLGEDVELDLMDGIQQPWAVLVVRNTDAEKKEEILKNLKASAEELVNGAMNHAQIQAVLNQMEFKYREKHEPAGLMYAQRCLETWLYDGDPTQNLQLGNLFEELRKNCEEGYFESLLKEFLLEDQLQELVVEPSLTMGAEREAKESKKLEEAKASWRDVQEMVDRNMKLDVWQASEDTPEAKASLPQLSLSDISEEPLSIAYEERRVRGLPVILHPTENTGIVYMNLYFSLAGITADHLPSLSFFANLLTQLPTKNKTVEQLQEAVRRDLGTLSIFLDTHSTKDETETTYPVIGVSCSVLKQNVNIASALILEVLKETVFEKETILPLLKQDNEDFRQMLVSSGQSVAMRRANAHFSAEGMFRECVGGYTSGLYEADFEKHYDEMIDAFINECEMYSEILFSKDRFTGSITGEENLNVIEDIVDGLNSVSAQPAKMHYPLLKDEVEAIQIPGGVSYSALVNNVNQFGAEYSSVFTVIAHMLTYDYLWNEVRVKGGAYGTGFTVSPSGNVGCYSFRDPDVMNALHAYSHIGEKLEEVVSNHTDLSQMIIGAIASGEPLMSPMSKVRVGDSMYFKHSTYERRKENRKKMLQFNSEQLAEYVSVLNKAMTEHPVLCVVGNEEALQKLEDKGVKVLEKL